MKIAKVTDLLMDPLLLRDAGNAIKSNLRKKINKYEDEM